MKPEELLPHIFSSAEGFKGKPEVLKDKSRETISEKDIVDFLHQSFKKAWGSSVWSKPRVNLWKLVEERDGKMKAPQVLRKYTHPLQPDIDFLYGPIANGERSAPLIGVEIKIFPEARYAGAIPKTRRFISKGVSGVGTGYYTGLDEAMAMLVFGLDYVYLWHFIILPHEIWEQYEKKYGEDFGKKLVKDHAEFSIAYGQITRALLSATGTTIGYLLNSLFLGDVCSLMPVDPKHTVKQASPNPLKNNKTPQKIRRLIMDVLEIQEQSGTFLQESK